MTLRARWVTLRAVSDPNLPIQMEELAALDEYEEALTLAELLPRETDRTRLTQVWLGKSRGTARSGGARGQLG